MSETTFENAKVGDRVWDIALGYGVIESISHSNSFYPIFYPILVNFVSEKASFTYDGKQYVHYNRTLFWSEIKYEVPVRPKRKVKKTLKGWIAILPSGFYRFVYDSKEEAMKKAPDDATDFIEVSGEYEVEE